MVLSPEKEAEAEAIFKKWGLDFAIVGVTTDTLRFVVKHQGDVVADLPIKELGDEAPEYDRPWTAPVRRPYLSANEIAEPEDYAEALKTLVGSANGASRRWVYEQYDTLIQGNSAATPGGDAGVIRVDGTRKGLTFSVDVTPRYCEADPFEGGKQAVAEVWRNLTAVGSEPLAATDNLNFGNPERPEIMGQFVGCIKGIGEACRTLDFPIVSGNVSLYNETHGEAILPTPAIGGVGLLPDVTVRAGAAFEGEGDAIIMVGGAGTHLGASQYLADVLGREEGAPPPVDLAAEKRNGTVVRQMIGAARVSAVHDISSGGLGVALAEMAMTSSIGATVAVDGPTHAALFGEDQGRYVLTVASETAEAVLKDIRNAGIEAAQIGVTGGTDLTVEGVLTISVANLKKAHEDWFPAYMATLIDQRFVEL